MSRCAGAGKEHSQAPSPSWPVEIFHIMDMMIVYEWGLAVGQESLFSFL